MKQMVRKKECSTKTKNTESLVRTKMDDKVISTNLPLFSSALIVLAAWKVTKMKDVTVAKEELKLFWTFVAHVLCGTYFVHST